MTSVELRARVLGILNEGPTYAVPIAERLDVVPARVSYVLHDLEADGLIEAWWTKETYPERGDRPRRMYRVKA